MENKKLLCIINGLGLGNSTRCSAIIHELFISGYRIDVVSSGNGLNYFSKSDEINKLFSFQALLYGKANGKLSVLKTLLMLPKLAVLFIKNCFYLQSLLKNTDYAAIVFDSDYSVASISWRRRRPLLIGINNAGIIVGECKKMPDLPRKIRMQYWIEKMDYWFHNLVPDIVICPVFKNNNQIKHSRIKYTSPIIRSGLISKPNSPPVENILVMLSGSQFGSDIYFLNRLRVIDGLTINVIGKQGESSKAVGFYGKVYDNRSLINAADMLVINAGFSAISEAIVLKKPAIVIPIENHAEQYINSLLFEKSGLGLLATQENAHEKITEMLSDFEKYRTAHHNFDAPGDGAITAAGYIVRAIESPRLNK